MRLRAEETRQEKRSSKSEEGGENGTPTRQGEECAGGGETSGDPGKRYRV